MIFCRSGVRAVHPRLSGGLALQANGDLPPEAVPAQGLPRQDRRHQAHRPHPGEDRTAGTAVQGPLRAGIYL